MSMAKAKQSKAAKPSASKQVPGLQSLDLPPWPRMLVNPQDNDPVRTPTLAPFEGAVRTFTRTYELARSDLATDSFQFRVSPTVNGTVQIPSKTPIVVSIASVFESTQSKDQLGITASEFLSNPVVIPYKGWRITVAGITTSFVVRPEFDAAQQVSYTPFVLTAGASYRVTVDFSSVGCYKWGIASRNAGVWTDVGVFDSGVGAVLNGPCDGFLLYAQYPLGQAPFKSAQLVWNAGAVAAIPQEHGLSPFSTDAVNLSEVVQQRVTALSTLVSYVGNEFNNGGVIAAARVRDYFPLGDPYEQLTKLQTKSYNGALKTGAYAWWLPYDFDELEFRHPLATPLNETSLMFAGRFSDPEGALRITVTMVVEFYSPLQIFEHLPGPALTDAFVRLYHGLDGVPAAMCNPSHKQVLKSVLKKARSGAKAGVSYLAANPDVLLNALSMLV